MKFVTKEDIEAPASEVFAALSDFGGFERAAMRRGADVVRTQTAAGDGVGQTWRAAFDYRGKRRVATIRLVQMEAPALLHFVGTSPTLEGDLQVELVALSPKRTRVSVSVDLTAKTLASRIFLQSLKLARGRLQDRFAKRVRNLAIGIEDRLRKPTLG